MVYDLADEAMERPLSTLSIEPHTTVSLEGSIITVTTNNQTVVFEVSLQERLGTREWGHGDKRGGQDCDLADHFN